MTKKEPPEDIRSYVIYNGVEVVCQAWRCYLRVWNPFTMTWWRTDLYQETPRRTDNQAEGKTT